MHFNGSMLLRNGVAMLLNDDEAGYLEDALNLLLEGDFQARWEAIRRLTELGQPALASLLPLLEEDSLDWEVRWFAARALAAFDTEEALRALMQILQESQDPELIAIAAAGLSRFEAKGIAALVQLLANPGHRLTAVQALANMHHTDVLAPLLDCAADPNPAVRQVAIAALGSFRNASADAVLIQAVQDPIAAVRQEAITNLGFRSHLLATTNLVDILLPGLWDIHLGVNRATALALGRLGTETAVSSLARVLTSTHTPEPLQMVIIQALSWTEKESALLALLAVRQQVSLAVQVALIEALHQLKTMPLKQLAAEFLLDWLQSLDTEPTPTLKQAIALALGNLQATQARSGLQQLAIDPDAQTRLYAEAALRQLAKGEEGEK